MNIRWAGIVAVAAAAVALGVIVERDPPETDISIDLLERSLIVGEVLRPRITVRAPAQANIEILKWSCMFHGDRFSLEVSKGGGPFEARRCGPHVFAAGAAPDDFETLAANTTRTRYVEVPGGDLSEPGDYRVRIRVHPYANASQGVTRVLPFQVGEPGAEVARLRAHGDDEIVLFRDKEPASNLVFLANSSESILHRLGRIDKNSRLVAASSASYGLTLSFEVGGKEQTWEARAGTASAAPRFQRKPDN